MDDEVKYAVKSWIQKRSPEFVIDGMRKLVQMRKMVKFLAVNGDCVEK